MVHDLHNGPGIDPGQVGEDPEAELGVVVKGPEDVRDIARPDPDLGLVAALANRPQEAVPEARREPVAKLDVHRGSRVARAQTPAGTVGPTRRSVHRPRRSRMSCWSFIIP